MAEVEEHERVAEPGGIGAAVADERKIVGRERAEPRDLELVRGWVEQSGPSIIAEQSPPRYVPSLPDARRPCPHLEPYP